MYYNKIEDINDPDFKCDIRIYNLTKNIELGKVTLTNVVTQLNLINNLLALSYEMINC